MADRGPDGRQDSSPILDVLVVGAGPGGTAVAFRAKELGFTTLVIDYDDILKRIRDYAKDKLILPDFGGGDRMRFPVGGSLFARLHFAPIDKDEMVVQWKRLYADADIAVKIGVELLGMTRRPDTIYNVQCYDHKNKAEIQFAARHVVIAIGRGVPRRFDIPGNTAGIAFRLEDAAAYVGAPACVIGGGTSAAEGVIAISNAKAAEKDPTCVYWSYRGDKMPRISKALAEAFFEAYVGNGNIRYFPKSDPAAIVTGEDRREYLAIRTDRKQMPDRPSESSYLEFAKESCVACIGEDIPEGLLNSMGIYMATGGPLNKKRMLVTKHLETQLPNVYLVGDILSQAYFETESFTADPTTYREVSHRGNIKSALIDGLRVAEVIHRRLRGESVDDIDIQYAEGEPAPVGSMVHATPIPIAAPVERPGPPELSLPEERRAQEAAAWLVRILPGDVQDNEYPLELHDVTTIGRIGCNLSFPDDTLLSDRHASISPSRDGFALRDDGAETGVWLQAREARDVEVRSGDMVRFGRQILVFAQESDRREFTHYNERGQEMQRYELVDGTIVVGRDAPQITLDEHDMTLSRRHLAVIVKDGRTFVRDLKSANGTYLRVLDSKPLAHGDRILVGRQRFVFSLRADAVIDTGHRRSVVSARAEAVAGAFAGGPPAAASPVAARAPAAAVPVPVGAPVATGAVAARMPGAHGAAAAGSPGAGPLAGSAPAMTGPCVTFRDAGKTLALRPGQTIFELAEENGIEIPHECLQGSCGADPIRIVAGSEHMNPIGDDEKDALEDVCKLKPGLHRLACVAKVKGPVVVEIVRD